MPTVKIYNMAGEVKGEQTLSDGIFGIKPNKDALFEAVKNHLANVRQGTQSALTRAEVSGGGIKPYRQKGTGRARQGSTRAPQFTHGGVVFAPKPRDYSYTLNKKLKRLALKSALSQKVLEGKLIVVDNIDLDAVKTKDFKKFLEAVNVSGKALVVTPEVRKTVVLSARNLPGVTTTTATILSPYSILNGGTFIVDAAALSVIEEVFA
jgi:large subunit ribosomal protein L4